MTDTSRPTVEALIARLRANAAALDATTAMRTTVEHLREAADALEAQSAELAALNARIDEAAELRVSAYHDSECRYEQERDAALATITEARDVWAGSWQFGLGFDDRLVLDRILSRGVQPAPEPWTDPAPYLNAKTGDRYAYRDAWPSMVNLTLKPRTRSQYDAENEMTRQHRDRYLAALGCECLLDITHGHNNSLDRHACHRCTNTWPQNSVRPVCLSNLK